MEEEEPVKGLKEIRKIEDGLALKGLVWARDPLPQRMTWGEATKHLEGTGWRLPTRSEMLTAFDSGNPILLWHLPSYYWSSNAVRNDLSAAWFVNMRYGNVDNHSKGHPISVWPVRDEATWLDLKLTPQGIGHNHFVLDTPERGCYLLSYGIPVCQVLNRKLTLGGHWDDWRATEAHLYEFLHEQGFADFASKKALEEALSAGRIALKS